MHYYQMSLHLVPKIKGALCCFGEEIFRQKTQIFINSLLLYFVYMWRTLPPSQLQSVLWEKMEKVNIF